MRAYICLCKHAFQGFALFFNRSNQTFQVDALPFSREYDEVVIGCLEKVQDALVGEQATNVLGQPPSRPRIAQVQQFGLVAAAALSS